MDNRQIKAKAIGDQSFRRYGATVYVFDCYTTTAFGLNGELVVLANSKIRKAERNAQIRNVVERYRRGERLGVNNAS